MDRFYIIANELKDIGYQITQEIQTYIEENGKKCIVATKDAEGHIVPGTVPQGIECAIVLGGDGTLIGAGTERISYSADRGQYGNARLSDRGRTAELQKSAGSVVF